MDAHGIEAREVVPASRKLGRSDAARLAKDAARVVVAKGKRVETFETAGKAGKGCVDAMLGPTGNLRAPTIRSGKTVVVGFHDEVFTDLFG